MEEGSLRCDANISLRPRGQAKFGTKVELKNINSFRFVEKAIEYEIERQAGMLDRGETIKQQTRLFNKEKNVTELMREKEEAHDYRYFPEPDLPALIISASWKEEIGKKMPELPDALRERFKSAYALNDYDAGVLTASRELGRYFEDVASATKNPKASANWIANELLGRLNAVGKEIDATPVTSGNLSELIKKIDSGEISGKIAKTVFEDMFTTGKPPGEIIKEKGLVQISDTGALEAAIKKVVAANPGQAAEYKAGKVKLLGFFVGQVMKETKGQANPGVLNELVKKILDA
jgi:aspartyl-tRNA(Asn)/glutamyl-tRNA(Gln) amidotransferase subunit B